MTDQTLVDALHAVDAIEDDRHCREAKKLAKEVLADITEKGLARLIVALCQSIEDAEFLAWEESMGEDL